MSFVSWSFAILFVVVVLTRLTIGRRKIEPAYVLVLLIASTMFYAWHVPIYILILLTSAGIDYVAALMLDKTPAGASTRRRWILAVSLGTNLGLLAFFKYANLATQYPFIQVKSFADFFDEVDRLTTAAPLA